MKTLLLIVSLCAACSNTAPARSSADVLSARCQQISDRERRDGAIAKAGLIATGTSGIATLPIEGDHARLAVATTTLALAVATGAFVLLRDSDASQWERECLIRAAGSSTAL